MSDDNQVLYPLENLWWEFKSIFNEKAPSTKKDLRIAIRESWKEYAEYYFKLLKFLPGRINDI